ncbi:MAG: M12 family metallo-peptidase [Planctomycetaceae bacterium]|nr:M12 family metallo-peptidase [Planctomycetaceae bacterium]
MKHPVMSTAALVLPMLASAALHAQAIPPYPHIDPAEVKLVDLVATRKDIVAAQVDVGALLGLREGDPMPADLAGATGAGQRVWRRRPGSDGGAFIHFRHPKNAGAMSDVFIRDGRVAAVVRDGLGGVDSVRTLDDGRMIRQVLDAAAAGECGGCSPTNGEGPVHGGGEGGIAGTCNDGNVFDVFVLVHSGAVVEMGGLQAALDEVLLAMELCNESYANTDIDLHARLVGIRIVSDTIFQGDNYSTDLARLRNPSDGFFDLGTDSRAEWGADMIKLMRVDDPVDGVGGVVGLGYTLVSSASTPSNAGFSVDSWTASISNLTFVHEIGHNMGCCHAPGDGGGCNDTNDAYYTYSVGNRFTGTSGTQYRTVMAYNPGTRIPYFSSPLVSFDGTLTGSATRDNRRSINNTRTVFCDYACSTVPDNDECSAATTIANGGTLTVTNDHATNYGTQGLTVGGSDYNDVWAKFTAPFNGRALVRLCPTSATTDTTLAVFEGSCSGEPIAFDVGTFGFEFCSSQYASAIEFPVVFGQEYLVRCSCTGNTVFTGNLRLALTSNGQCGLGTGSCFTTHAAAGCNNFTCCGTVCGVDPFCCDTQWDATCVGEANDWCAQCGDTANGCFAAHAASGCADAACCAQITALDSTCGNFEWDAACAELAMQACAGCGSPSAGSCRVPHAGTGCSDGACCIEVCTADAFCCEDSWDTLCANQANALCPIPGDFNGDGRVNAQDLATLLNAWGTAACDITGDGTTNAQDIAALLNAWTG